MLHSRRSTQATARSAQVAQRLSEAGIELASLHDPQQLIEAVCAHAHGLLHARWVIIAAAPAGNATFAVHTHTCGADCAGLPAPELHAGWLGTIHADRITRRLDNPDGGAARLGLPAAFPRMRAVLAAPLLSDNQSHGWICLTAHEGKSFTADDERVLTLFAALVGRLYSTAIRMNALLDVASESERRHEATLAERQRLEALRDLEAAMRSVSSPRDVARMALEHLGSHLAYWGASVMQMDASGAGAIVLAYCNGDAGAAYNPGQYLTAAQYGQDDLDILRKGGICYEPRILAPEHQPAVIECLHRQGMRCFARVPLLVDGAMIGVLNLAGDVPGQFSAAHLDFARQAADHLAVAM